MSAIDLSPRSILGMIQTQIDTPSNGWVDPLIMTVDTDQGYEKFAWLGTTPLMREWIGERQANGLRSNAYELSVKDFELTMEVRRDELRRDKLGQIQARINQMSERVNDHDAQLLSKAVMAGQSAVCYDGQYFFSASHSEGKSGTQSNIYTADITTPTKPLPAEFEDAILSGVQQMVGLKDDQGEPLNGNAKNFTVMVPVAHMKAAAAALGASVVVDPSIGTGAARSNLVLTMASVGGFNFDLVINPRLTNSDRFYMFRKDGAVKPFIKLDEVKPLAKMEDDTFNNKRYLYGIERTMNIGYGLWTGSLLVSFT